MVQPAFPIGTRALWFLTLALAGLVLASAAWVFPNFESADLRWGDGEPEADPWPWVSVGDAQTGSFSLTTRLNLPPLHPRRFLVVADDELRVVELNGQPTATARIPITFDDLHPASLDLGAELRPGPNVIRFDMANGGGPAGLRIHAHPQDTLCLVWTLALVGVSGLGVCLLARHAPGVFGGWCGVVFFVGVALRILYWAATPYYLRAYDWGGHIQFLKYVAEHLALPPADLGWETHQPPLYYILGGLWMRLTGQSSASWLYGQWSAFSLFLSIGCLIIVGLLAARFFPAERNRRVTFLAILAVFPSLIFHATRISNDVLFAFLSFLWVWLLLRWWESPSWKRWSVLAACVGITFLVKNGALVLAGATVLCAVWRLKSPVPLAKSLGILALAVLLLSGWYQIPKAVSAASPSSFVVGNIHGWTRNCGSPAIRATWRFSTRLRSSTARSTTPGLTKTDAGSSPSIFSSRLSSANGRGADICCFLRGFW